VQAIGVRSRRFLPELALIAATVAYGATFVIVQDALDDTTPAGFILLRFTVGTIALAPFAIQRGFRRRDAGGARCIRGGRRSCSRGRAEPESTGEDVIATTSRDFVRAAVVFGVVGFLGYWLQNAGLERTTTSNSAFITGLFVVFTPLIEVAVTRRAPDRRVLLAVVVSAFGLYLLTGASVAIRAGDALTLGCAFMFAVWIMLGHSFSQRFDAIALTTAQMAVLVLCSIPAVLLAGVGTISGRVVVAVLVTGVLCSSVAFTLQLWGQRSIEPTRAAVILMFEPVVAGFVGYLAGERLGVTGYIGAFVILAGIVIAESRTWRGQAQIP
jgi:drug/metabolite transporter (DMT)-like permease